MTKKYFALLVVIEWQLADWNKNIFCCFIKIKDLVKKCFVKCNHSDLLLPICSKPCYVLVSSKCIHTEQQFYWHCRRVEILCFQLFILFYCSLWKDAEKSPNHSAYFNFSLSFYTNLLDHFKFFQQPRSRQPASKL